MIRRLEGLTAILRVSRLDAPLPTGARGPAFERKEGIHMILVVGASGNLGRETVRLALDAGFPVRAAARQPEKLAHLTDRGVEVVHLDLVDPDSIARACRGVDGVVATAHSLVGSGVYRSPRVDGTGNQTLFDAARNAGVRHIVFLSTVGAAPAARVAFFRTKYAAEEHLRRSGIGYTILRPTAYMETHAHEFMGLPLLEKGKVTIVGAGRNPLNLIAAADVARYVMLGLTDPRAHNRILEIGGWDNRSHNELAAAYARIADITPRIRHLPLGVVKTASAVLQPFKPEVSDLLRLLDLVETTDQTLDPTELQREFPFEMIRLDDFIRHDVESFMNPTT